MALHCDDQLMLGRGWALLKVSPLLHSGLHTTVSLLLTKEKGCTLPVTASYLYIPNRVLLGAALLADEESQQAANQPPSVHYHHIGPVILW